METFFANIKLQSGEELLCVVSETNVEDDYVKIKYPVEIEEIEIPGVIHGLKIKYWLKTSKQDEFLIPGDKIVCFTEIQGEAIEFYKESIYKLETGDYHETPKKRRTKSRKDKTSENGRVSIDKDMGLLSSIDDAREFLESIFNQDSYNKEDSKDPKDH